MSYTPYRGPSTEDQAQDYTQPRSGSALLRRIMLGGFTMLLIALIGLLAWSLAARSTDPTRGLVEEPKVGSLAPDFELKDVNTGRMVKLSSLRGRPVWINFWASWCPPCRDEMPDMENLYAQYKDKGLVILGVNVQEKSADVLTYLKESGFSWSFVLDTDGKITDRYLIMNMPSHFFVDKNGVIRAVHTGGLKNMAGLRAPVEEYLGKIIAP